MSHAGTLAAGSVSRRILGATAVVAVSGVLVKAAGLLKEVRVAAVFGAGLQLDAFLLAFLPAAFLANVVARPLGSAIVPRLVWVRERKGGEAARRLLGSVLVLELVALGAVAALLAACAGPLVDLLGAGFTPAKRDVTVRLLRALAPLVPLQGLALTLAAVLQSRERFLLSALVPGTTPLLVLALLLGATEASGATLAAGVVCGAAFELAFLAAALLRSGDGARPRWAGYTSDLRAVLAQYAPLLSSAVLLSAAPLIDHAMAATLAPGSVASLAYAHKLVSLPVGLGGMALGTAVLPYFSRMVARGDHAELRRTVRRLLLLVFAVAVPGTVAVVFLREPLVALLFERGSFGPDETARVAGTFAALALQIPFHIGGVLLGRLVSTLLKNRLLFAVTGAALALNVVLNLLWMPAFGVAGIAFSTSAVYLFTFAALWIWWRRAGRAS